MENELAGLNWGWRQQEGGGWLTMKVADLWGGGLVLDLDWGRSYTNLHT